MVDTANRPSLGGSDQAIKYYPESKGIALGVNASFAVATGYHAWTKGGVAISTWGADQATAHAQLLKGVRHLRDELTALLVREGGE